MRLHQLAANRRKLIPTYSNRMWISSGQERANARLRIIKFSVTDCFEPETIGIFSKNDENRCKKVVALFCTKRD